MTFHIITDIDDTVLDFEGAFTRWALSKPELIATIAAPSLASTGSIPAFLGLDRFTCDKVLEAYARDGDAFARIPAYAHAVVVLRRLQRHHGCRLVAISSCVTGRDVVERRRRNLVETTGCTWDAVHCVGLGASKADILGAYAPTVWVEDNLGHAIAGAALGHNAYLLDRPYNQGPAPGVTRVRDWIEIAGRLDRLVPGCAGPPIVLDTAA